MYCVYVWCLRRLEHGISTSGTVKKILKKGRRKEKKSTTYKTKKKKGKEKLCQNLSIHLPSAYCVLVLFLGTLMLRFSEQEKITAYIEHLEKGYGQEQ